MKELEEAGQPYRIPEEFVDRRSLNEIGRNHYEGLEELGRWAAGWLESAHEDLAVNPVFIHFYRLKLYLDSIALRVAEAAAVLRVLRPVRVVVIRELDDPFLAPPDTFEFITLDGPVYASVVPFMAGTLGIEVETVDVASPARRGRNLRACLPRCNSWLSRFRDGFTLCQCLVDRFAPGDPAWVLGEGYHDIPHLIGAGREVGNHKYRSLSFWSGPVGKRCAEWLEGGEVDWIALEKTLVHKWAATREDLVRHPVFTVDGVSFFSLVERQLEHLFTKGVVQAEQCYRAARRLARSRRVRYLLATHTGSYRDLVLTQALKDLGVPVIYAQEGGFSGYCEYLMPHFTELCFSDYFLTYGPGVATWLASPRLTSRQQGRPLAVGGLRFRTLQSRRATAGRRANGIARVMYIPTADFHHSLRYAPLNYSDREYYAIKRRVIETLLSLPDVQVTYKVPPATLAHDSCLGFVSKHRDRIRVSEAPLTAVLDEAELFVVDWPSTVLLEVLTTTRPVLVLTDRVVCRPIPEAMRLLRKRAFVAEDLDAFLEAVQRVIGAPETAMREVDLEDTAFIDAYATGGKEGWSPEELARFLASV